MTKMLFGVLVLAFKVERADKEFGDIRIRCQRSLCGAWAEREAGGEIAEQEGIPSTILAVLVPGSDFPFASPSNSVYNHCGDNMSWWRLP